MSLIGKTVKFISSILATIPYKSLKIDETPRKCPKNSEKKKNTGEFNLSSELRDICYFWTTSLNDFYTFQRFSWKKVIQNRIICYFEWDTL